MKKKNSSVTVGDISNISGSQINISSGDLYLNQDGSEFIGGDKNSPGVDVNELNKLLLKVNKLIDEKRDLSKTDKSDLKADIKEGIEEIKKNNKADSNFISRRLQNLKRMAPDILDVILSSLSSPALCAATIAKKVAEKMKSDSSR